MDAEGHTAISRRFADETEKMEPKKGVKYAADQGTKRWTAAEENIDFSLGVSWTHGRDSGIIKSRASEEYASQTFIYDLALVSDKVKTAAEELHAGRRDRNLRMLRDAYQQVVLADAPMGKIMEEYGRESVLSGLHRKMCCEVEAGNDKHAHMFQSAAGQRLGHLHSCRADVPGVMKVLEGISGEGGNGNGLG